MQGIIYSIPVGGTPNISFKRLNIFIYICECVCIPSFSFKRLNIFICLCVYAFLDGIQTIYS